ncbi:basic proline-rich protein-like [Oenanthe melanoleuca]|uniref:basic proline-rich protein-like n=1 Tax=Oenanthe melanoleuca TaxID=2939378 RepID=UPI0024C1BA23|nr:basic proline-rich protein-like [Oenanthe melanoleuca]
MLKPPGPSGEAPVSQGAFALSQRPWKSKKREMHWPMHSCAQTHTERPAQPKLPGQVSHHRPGARRKGVPVPTLGQRSATGTPLHPAPSGHGPHTPPARAAAPCAGPPAPIFPASPRPARRLSPLRGRSLAHPPCRRPGPAPLRQSQGPAAPAALGCGGHRLPAEPGPPPRPAAPGPARPSTARPRGALAALYGPAALWSGRSAAPPLYGPASLWSGRSAAPPLYGPAALWSGRSAAPPLYGPANPRRCRSMVWQAGPARGGCLPPLLFPFPFPAAPLRGRGRGAGGGR